MLAGESSPRDPAKDGGALTILDFWHRTNAAILPFVGLGRLDVLCKTTGQFTTIAGIQASSLYRREAQRWLENGILSAIGIYSQCVCRALTFWINKWGGGYEADALTVLC